MSTATVERQPVAASAIATSAFQDEVAWNRFVDAHPLATVDHLWGWRRVFHDVFHHESEYLVAQRDGDCIGVLPLVLVKSHIFGRCVVSLPMLDYGGLLVTEPAAAQPLLAHAAEVARGFGARHVELRHRVPLTTLPAKQHKASMRLALPTGAATLWNGLDRKVRNQVRKAQKSRMTLESGGVELLDAFYRVFSENMRDLGTPVYPKRLFSEACAEFPDRTRAFVVRHLGRPVAAAVMLRFKDTVLVPWASSLRGFRHLCPNMLLYWSMLEWAIDAGFKIFDFGRSTPNGGTYHFKLQWGAAPEPQFWEYLLLGGAAMPDHGRDDGRFSLAIETWKRLPLWLANAAGPTIVRNIP